MNNTGGTLWSNIKLKECDSHVLWALLVKNSKINLLSPSYPFPLILFLHRYSMILVSPEPWALYCSVGFMITALPSTCQKPFIKTHSEHADSPRLSLEIWLEGLMTPWLLISAKATSCSWFWAWVVFRLKWSQSTLTVKYGTEFCWKKRKAF